MIRPDKMKHALLVLHDIFVQARYRAYKLGDDKLIDLLDDAEILPVHIASDEDQTDDFRLGLESIAQRCDYLGFLERFDSIDPGTH